MTETLELFLFSTDQSTIREADRVGIDGIVVDWEDRQRFDRKHHSDDLQRPDSVEALRRAASSTERPIWCRINQPGAWNAEEIELAIEHGAGLILLPMVRGVGDVEDSLELIGGRVAAGILVETVDACGCAEQLASLPLDCIYVGLLDLSTSRGSGDLFEPLIDGTVERLRKIFHSTRFGVGGLTTIDRGFPMPCLELMEKLVRVGCDFTFLRNAFKRDIEGRDMAHEVGRIHSAWHSLSTRYRKAPQA